MVEVLKVSGEKEAYSKEKFCASLRDAGAPEDLVVKTCSAVEHDLSPGISTREIFRNASSYLMRESLPVAMKYNVKRALFSLGPAGFHFEQYAEVLFNAQGFTTERNIMMEGRCVEHEIDIIARKDNAHFLVEAKYRNDQKVKTGIEILMYADARLLDITPSQESKEQDGSSHKMWLVTNAKFTSKAIQYGKCRGLTMTGWNYPKGKESLQNIIYETKRYPVTVLPSVRKSMLDIFARENMMLAQDLLPYSSKDLADRFGISETDGKKIVAEVHALVGASEE